MRKPATSPRADIQNDLIVVATGPLGHIYFEWKCVGIAKRVLAQNLVEKACIPSQCQGAVLFCGDLNTTPKSPIYREFQEKLHDVSSGKIYTRRKSTWPSQLPLRKIDYIFVNQYLRVVHAFVVRTKLSRVASDHLPVVVDVEWGRI